mmetsp:Transcript_33200/g.89920  ORF Transcript_33200/g.89920 Transcript_33200/m.89920 type:complete len:222 (-) Transcript_33200:142-807(-)|eukprot:CAMPEP_0171177546 /NCGR_PEP_ID=MMETSP0790-20130122/12295_1 /TAXON_ID=2925 /ORGANISM="Alexandrium catenella, Strain OF101" /LENGTH=221 /DNA_ID=CAMNT_0011642447 /DNA_START=75 /DNA_END=740 /DNA_ORIENTATION=-
MAAARGMATLCLMALLAFANGEQPQPSCKSGDIAACATPSSSMVQRTSQRSRTSDAQEEEEESRVFTDEDAHAMMADEEAGEAAEKEKAIALARQLQSLAQISSKDDGTELFVITVDEGCKQSDLDAMAPYVVKGTTPVFEGDGNSGGFCVFLIRDTRANVDHVVGAHPWSSPAQPTIETNGSWKNIPQITIPSDNDTADGDDAFEEDIPLESTPGSDSDQ